MTTGSAKRDFSIYLRREPVLLALLFGLAVLAFLAVGALSRIFHAQQDALAIRWSTRGAADLKLQHFESAATEFRTALLYSRGNFSYELGLAQALIGQKRTSEADAYLINLWGRRPENGLVNLELARTAAGRGDTEQALRYYHNAIYAPWPGDQEAQERNARLELINYLLGINARTQAQSEMISLAANLEDDPTQQTNLGALFMRAKDYEHGLAAYRRALSIAPHDPAALAGAGLAAYELGRYPMAQRYLQHAVEDAPGDTASAALLRITELVLQMDPFRRQIRVAQRDRSALDAFAVAGKRLKSCPHAAASLAPAKSREDLQAEWGKMKPQMTERGFRNNPDLVNAAMELVFKIERTSNQGCQAPTDADVALLLIAKLHEGS